ncbi:MAG: hypothetical protein SGARI_004874 [Bacillariaceae sp.]
MEKVVPIWLCPVFLDGVEGAERLVRMFECEKQLASAIQESLGESDSFDLVVLDGGAPLVAAQIANSVLTVPKYREQFLGEFNIFMTWSNKPVSQTWQRNFLERYRKEVLMDPVTRAEMKVEIGKETLEFGLVSSGDLAIFHNLSTLEKKIKKRLAKMGSNASVEVVKIQGGVPTFNHDYTPKEFPHADYDQAPGDKQYAEQQPIGREAIIQFELNGEKEDANMPGMEDIKRTFELTLSSLKYEVTRSETYTGIGDGALMVSEFEQGSVVLIWDGRDHIDMNLFLFDDQKDLADAIASKFVYLTEENVQVGLRDDFPRGLGRVVNFKDDLVYQGFDSIAEKQPYVDP